ncbi:hypothetical protein [Bradyrhizobium sp. CER78]|uniref:hypothetical protein n=1 Tax=Bradyrhizobium sp. CER78 TaxID=3039162 RepID=UPI00244C6E8A|nr:hypothetical protein [Bradyrhizobium sp. CER78]MDH2385610.1 hypothetical protein [Bradyrhizobium sp. CER78]
MIKVNDIFAPPPRPAAAPTVRHINAHPDPFVPVMRSIVGLVSESAGLLRHVAALGAVLLLDTSTEPKRRPAARPAPAPDATNIIRFPATRTSKPRKQEGTSHDRRE